MTTRRDFVRYGAALGAYAGLSRLLPAYALPGSAVAAQRGDVPGGPGPLDLRIGEHAVRIGEREAVATTVNGKLPGPLLRLREGDDVRIRVANALNEDTSIHWHGILLPNGMDGVPKVTFPGIRPRETFEYRIPVRQSGTYWYHSHSGLQEQTGVYGPLVIDPLEPEPFEYEREYVVVLSDWTFGDPYDILANLKKRSGYYNFQRRTVGDLFSDIAEKGLGRTVSDRLMWGRMRMDPTDIADITGYALTYLMNGMPPGANWTGLFRPGERVRLRFINAAAATYFDVRIPGLEMTVIQADGQNVQPVQTEEFRIAIAETYDVIIQPNEERAFSIFAETMDRSGYAAGTLAPKVGMTAEIPPRRERPIRDMAHIGMDMDNGMDMPMPEAAGAAEGGHAAMGHGAEEPAMVMDPVGSGAPVQGAVRHGPDEHGPGASMIARIARPQLDDPGVGLGGDGRRVLVYRDLRSVESVSDEYDGREPGREIELHLTGNMERYMWSFDGKKFSQVDGPIPFVFGERLRIIFVNDTMMEHPIHLHGMWMELENGAGRYRPRKHTVNVKPAERMSVLVTADAPGPWALHCHILYHMEAGMFRVVEVSDPAAAPGAHGGHS